MLSKYLRTHELLFPQFKGLWTVEMGMNPCLQTHRQNPEHFEFFKFTKVRLSVWWEETDNMHVCLCQAVLRVLEKNTR